MVDDVYSQMVNLRKNGLNRAYSQNSGDGYSFFDEQSELTNPAFVFDARSRRFLTPSQLEAQALVLKDLTP